MSRFAQIDLSQLPAPNVIEALDYKDILARNLADLIARAPDYADALALESEPLRKWTELLSYVEVLLRARVNDGARATMLATATGADLENLAALFGVARLVVVAATDKTDAVFESDAALRARAQLAPEAYTSAGTVGAYEFHARSADARVRDVTVTSPEPGMVQVAVLSREGDGAASDDLLAAVRDVVAAPDVRALCHEVNVISAAVIPYFVQAELHIASGPDASTVALAARTALDAYTLERLRLGATVALSGVLAALHQSGVERVVLNAPVADIDCAKTAAPWCVEIALSVVEVIE